MPINIFRSLSFLVSLSLSSVPVVSRLVRTLDWHTNVISLILAELGKPSSKLGKVKCGNLLIKVLGQDINLLLVLARSLLLPQFELRNHLVGERARHHEAGMPGGTTQVHEPPLSQDNDA